MISLRKNVEEIRRDLLQKKRLWHKYLPVKFCEISKNTFFHRTPLVAASADTQAPISNPIGVRLDVETQP